MKRAPFAYAKRLLWSGPCLCFAMMDLSKAEVVEDSVYSPVLARTWAYHVYLPPSYDGAENQTYPVLFLLHGSAGDETAWDPAFPGLDDLIVRGEIAPVVAIAPASATSWWVDGVEPIESAFFSDLIPDVRDKYPVRNHREAWVVAGFSMGGYGALRFALTYPEQFGGAILLSPALYAEQPPDGSSARTSGAFGRPFNSCVWASRNYTALLPDYLAREMPVQLFIGAGDDDWNHPGDHGLNMEIQTTMLYNKLNKQYGSPAELRIVDGSHDWALWLPLFEEGMKVMARDLSAFRAAPP